MLQALSHHLNVRFATTLHIGFIWARQAAHSCIGLCFLTFAISIHPPPNPIQSTFRRAGITHPTNLAKHPRLVVTLKLDG